MEAKASDWRPGPTVCRCCLTEGCYKDISTEYFWMGKREVYAEMLSETLNVSIAFSKSGGPNSNSRLICEPCISRLRDAAEFKRQVIDCEKTFMHHLDPGSSSRSKEFTVETIGEVKVEVVKREKESISDDDFDDRPDFLDVDTDDDLDDQPLTKLASKIPKKEATELLDLLDTSQITVKRKSNLKLKAPPKKIVKKKEVVAKPSASKAAPAKQAEKKKDDEWTTSEIADKMNTPKTPSDEWITTDIKETIEINVKLERESSDSEENLKQNDAEWITTDTTNPITTNPIKLEVPDCSGTQKNLMAPNKTTTGNDEWIVSDTTEQVTEEKKITNENKGIITQTYMKLRVRSKEELSATFYDKPPATEKPNRSRRGPKNQTEDNDMLWACIGQKWIKILITDKQNTLNLTEAERKAMRSRETDNLCSNDVEHEVIEGDVSDDDIIMTSSMSDSRRITRRLTCSRGKVTRKNKRGGGRPARPKKHLENARLLLKNTTAIPIRIELSSIDIPCFACQGKFIDPFSFREHFLAEHKDVDKTKGMHLYNNVQTRADITDLACLLCGLSFDTLDDVAQHLLEEHKIALDMEEKLGLVPLKFSHIGQFICALCQKKCMTFRDLYRHSGFHFHFHVCEVCGKTFESTAAMTNHRNQSHVDGYRCKYCKVVYSTSQELRQHVKKKGCSSAKCKICKQSFAYDQLLQKHRETAHGAPKRIYQCLECPKVYEKRMMLYFHIKREHTDHYKCGSCGKTFTDSHSLKLHMPVHTGERPYKCQVCQQTFKSRTYFKTHIEMKYPNVSAAKHNAVLIVRHSTVYPFRLPENCMVCVFCCESYEKPSAFRQHMDIEHQTFSVRIAFAHCSEGYVKADCSDIRCRICFKPCESLEEIGVHLIKTHQKPLDLTAPLGIQPFKPDKLKCAICETKAFSLRQLSRHTQTHFHRFTCESCGKSYATNTALQVHIKYSHIIKEHYCRKCRTKFSSLDAKRNHLQESPRCWPYLCNTCGDRFLSWNLKQIHMKEVHGVTEEPNICPECGSVFTDKTAVRHHFKVAHTDDNFVCSFCGLKFATKKHFEEHRLIHTNEKPYPCTVCSKSFSRKKNLAQHLWVHSEYKRFECKLCNKKFNQRVSWKSHNKTNHPELLNFEQENDSSVKFLMSVLKK